MHLTKAQLEMAHAALLVTIKQAINRELPSTRFGICRNWRLNMPASIVSIRGETLAYALVPKLSRLWPGFNGYAVNPINRTHEGLWEGANLAARLSLMRYMLKRLRDMKRRAKE